MIMKISLTQFVRANLTVTFRYETPCILEILVLIYAMIAARQKLKDDYDIGTPNEA